MSKFIPKRETLIKKFQEEVIAQIALARPILENDLYKFNWDVLGVAEGKDKLGLATVHLEMCRFIDGNKKKKKLLLIPRGHLKSTLVTIGRTLQAITQDPTKRVLIANATYNLACSFLTEIKRQLKFNENLKMFWGELAKDPLTWSQNEITLASAKAVAGKKEPTVTAMGIESNLTSQHYDLIILDDLVNKDYVNSKEQIEKTIDFYRECLNLLEPEGELIIIGTRWHDSDLYGWIMDKDNNVISDFDVFVQRAFEGSLDTDDGFTAIWPQKFNRKHLKKLYEQQGPYFFCSPANSPVLMADFTNKPISEVKKGDKVVGFYRGEGNKNGRMVVSKVKAISTHEDYVYDFKMESGRKVACTKTHNWYTRRQDKTHHLYRPARIGSRLLLVADPDLIAKTEKEKSLWQYLAGFFDGDGSALGGSRLLLTQSESHNPEVYKKVIDTLKRLKIPYGEYKRDGLNNMVWLNDSFNTCLKFIRNADFGKKQQIIDRIYQESAKFAREKDKVLYMKKRPNKEPVYGLETTTGNYVLWGYASSNSTQWLNDPIPDTDATFHRDWFRYYEPLDLRGRILTTFTTIDPAISLEKAADYTAIVTTSLDIYSNVYVREIVRKRFTPQQIISELFRIWEQWHPSVIGLEDVVFQKTLQYALSEEMRKRNTFLPVREVRPMERSKEERIKGLQPLYNNSKVYHAKVVPSIGDLEDELMRFPRGKHDDCIDALSYGLDIWYPPAQRKSSHHHHQYLY